MTTGQTLSCARLSNGRLQCWGDNSAGQLGDGRALLLSVSDMAALSIDADETVPPALRLEMEAAVKSPGPHQAFEFPRCTLFCGRWIRHGDWYPDRQTRLWRRGQARWGGIDPHDRLGHGGGRRGVGRRRDDGLWSPLSDRRVVCCERPGDLDDRW